MRSVTAKDYLGAVTLVAREGRTIEHQAYGWRDVAKTSRMERDAIFRIYSMTKSVTSVAVLILVEEGKLLLDDPIARYLPDFERVQVFAGGTADAPVLRAPARAITIRHLLAHTAGLAAGSDVPAELVELTRGTDLEQSPDLATFVARLSRWPLASDPGERFRYDGVNTEVLSRLIEVVGGEPFDRFLQRRILGPLHLSDTSFAVPMQQRHRIADLCTTDRNGRLVLSPEKTARHPGEPLRPYPSGAGGLYSTAADYARFAQMLLNGGELDGVSILSAKMLEHPDWEGQFGWSGAASTYYTVDRSDRLIAILMMQHLPQGLPRDPQKISGKFYNRVHQALH